MAELGHEDEAWRKGLDGVLVVIFREQTLERWHVQGEIPCGLDDLVRNICLQGDPPKAVVTVSLELFEYEETWYRAVKMVSEACGVRFQRILAMLWSEGDTDRVRDRQDELRDRVRARGGDGGVAALEPLVCPRCRATWDHGSTCPTCDVPLVGASVVDVYEAPPARPSGPADPAHRHRAGHDGVTTVLSNPFDIVVEGAVERTRSAWRLEVRGLTLSPGPYWGEVTGWTLR